MWRAIPLWNPAKGTLDYWLKFKADGRMITVLRNWGYNKNSMHDWVDEVPDFLSTAELPSSVEVAYHNGEIIEAINTLTSSEREYIYLRFWKGYNYPELMKYFGYQPQALQRRSFDKLRKELAHLGAE
jgi:DNA-directed RNA polymerase specialized sigma24 family protein